MKTMHTPGPWTVDTIGNGLPITHPSARREAYIVGRGGNVASVNLCANPRKATGDSSLPDTEYGDLSLAASIRDANARLIAAAPELLAALESFLRAPSVGSNGPGSSTIVVQEFNIRAAWAAVEKATGT